MNTMTHRPARELALARQDQAIAESTQRALAAKPRPSALAVMASRLNVSEKGLSDTLRHTVFKNASDAEFIALVIVANEYGLNPLLKEMYAFPKKGGGIEPMVSVDGWIKLMNGHPAFDGIDFEYIVDPEDKCVAVEAIIHRKDRTRPVRVTEYLDECRRETDPWRKSPNRMLRHRAMIQCARVAFGFSGIADEGDVDDGPHEIVQATTVLPRFGEDAARGDDPVADGSIGAVEQVEEDPEIAAELDRRTYAEADGGLFDQETGEVIDDAPAASPIPLSEMDEGAVRKATIALGNAKTIAAVMKIANEFDGHRIAMGERAVALVDEAIERAHQRLGA